MVMARKQKTPTAAPAARIVNDVMETDLDDTTKKIIATALENLGRLCERERRRRMMN
jgi:hypothetical protein